MSFISIETWEVRSQHCAHAASLYQRNTVTAWRLNPRSSEIIRRGSAAILSAMVHLGILWLFIHKLNGISGPSIGSAGDGDSITLIDVYDTRDPSIAYSQQQNLLEKMAGIPSKVEKSELDTSTATEIKPEWSVASIEANETNTQPPAPLQHAGAATTEAPFEAESVARGGRGKTPYDPYAGATPIWPEATIHAKPTLDRQLFDSLVDNVRAAFPPRAGAIRLTARIGPDGTVLDIVTDRELTTNAAFIALREAMIGKPLFKVPPGSAPMTIMLPEVPF